MFRGTVSVLFVGSGLKIHGALSCSLNPLFKYWNKYCLQ